MGLSALISSSKRSTALLAFPSPRRTTIMQHVGTNSYIEGQFEGMRFKADEGASIKRVVRCAMLTLIFAEEFYEHRPRNLAFQWFAPIDRTFNELIYIEDEDFAQFNLQDVPGIHELRVRVSTQREAAKYPADLTPKFHVFMITDLLDSKGELMKDSKGQYLTSDIVLEFKMDVRKPELIRQLEDWSSVVNLLRSAAYFAWEDNGDFKNVLAGYKHQSVGILKMDCDCQMEKAKATK